MMDEPHAIQRLRGDMAPLLDNAGFRPESPGPQWSGKHYFVNWKRAGGWKDDVIVCHWRPRARFVSIEAHWTIPRAGRHPLMVSGINASYVFRKQAWYPLPLRLPLLGASIAARWRSRVLRDVEKAVGWLDACQSQSGALADLLRVDRNGPGAGTEAYEYAERYIREHAVIGGSSSLGGS